jgi:outer membrane immunogenic protein
MSIAWGDFMKKLLSTTVAFGLLALPALAADLKPVYKAPPPVPVCAWCGFYVGANAGYTWSSDSYDTSAVGTSFNPVAPAGAGAIANALATLGTTALSPSKNGFIGGGQVGYNWQFGNIVAGLEADIQGASASGSAAVSTVTPLSGPGITPGQYTSTLAVSERLNYLGTARGRAGFLVTPAWLLYGTGGLAYGGVSGNAAISAAESDGNPPYPPVSAATGFSGTRTGWTAGAGIEWMLAPHWIVRGEYLHYDLGSVTTGFTLTQVNLFAGGVPWGAATYSSTAKFDGDIVRGAVSYKF